MEFDFERWKVVLRGSGDLTIGADDILAAAGLIGSRDFEDELCDLLREIEADLDEADREDTRKMPPELPASS